MFGHKLAQSGNNINNAWQHVIFIYLYRCKTDKPTLKIISKLLNIFIMPRKCLNHLDQFCIVCGKFTSKEQQSETTHDIKKYVVYFGCPLDYQDKSWAPYKRCKKCCLGFHNWLNKQCFSMLFTVPMIGHKPKNHCQYCLIKGIFS